MNVFLTIDVETYTGDYTSDVDGHGKGLPYILERLNKFKIGATFFVEALAATRWGIEPIRDICALIMDFGQDIQLHIHPKVAKIDKIRIIDDRLWKYNKDTQKRLIEVGLGILDKCGVENVIAFRAGDLAANIDTLAVMEEVGLYLSSNRDLDMKSSIHTRINDHFPITNDISKRGNIIDIPVTAFRSAFPFIDGRYRHFEICALGAGEMKGALFQMMKTGYQCAGVLTHPSEFFRSSEKESQFIGKNCRRFEALLKYLHREPEMNTLRLGRCSPTISLPEESPLDIRLSLPCTIIRVWEQGLDRIFNTRKTTRQNALLRK